MSTVAISNSNPFAIPETKGEFSEKKIMLLLVEDDKVNQMLGKKMLVKAGFEVDVADDGVLAVEKLNSKPFDMVITDIKLPNMDGYKLTEYIRKSAGASFENIPIIATSAYHSYIEKQKALQAGVNEYIAKPFSVQILIDAIRRNLYRQ